LPGYVPLKDGKPREEKERELAPLFGLKLSGNRVQDGYFGSTSVFLSVVLVVLESPSGDLCVVVVVVVLELDWVLSQPDNASVMATKAAEVMSANFEIFIVVPFNRVADLPSWVLIDLYICASASRPIAEQHMRRGLPDDRREVR